MKKKKPSVGKIQNRRAKFDYELGDDFVVGMALNGRETKALRMGHGHLRGSFVNVKDGELWLVNATITSVPGVSLSEDEQVRTRKLLAKKREIAALMAAKDQGRTIVPTEVLTRGRYIKLRIAIGKGKKNYDKRQALKKRDEERSIRGDV
jgi:SsrA-binding protein